MIVTCMSYLCADPSALQLQLKVQTKKPNPQSADPPCKMLTPSQKVSDFSTQLGNVSLGLPVQSDKVKIVTRVVQYLDHLPSKTVHHYIQISR